jgi:hypothetical protein
MHLARLIKQYTFAVMIIKSAILFLRVFDAACDIYEWGLKIKRKFSRKQIYSESIIKNANTVYTIS